MAFLLCVLLAHFQDYLIFLPNAVGNRLPEANPEGFRHPGEWQVPYEDVYIKSEDDTALHLWLMRPENLGERRARPTILFFQGNAGNMGFRLYNLAQMYKYLNVNVAALSYRGFGRSSGFPSESGILADGRAALRYLANHRPDLDGSRIFLFGRSVGGAVAIHTAEALPSLLKGMVVENTFWNIEEIALSALPLFKLAPRLLTMLLRTRLDSCLRIAEFTKKQKHGLPALFIVGKEDQLVPPSHSARLFSVTDTPFRWLLQVTQGTHNDSWQIHPKAYYSTLANFIKAAEQAAKDPLLANNVKVLELNSSGAINAKASDIIPELLRRPATSHVPQNLESIEPRPPRAHETSIRYLKPPARDLSGVQS